MTKSAIILVMKQENVAGNVTVSLGLLKNILGGNITMKLKKYLTIALSAVMATVALTGCSSSSNDSSSDDTGSVYYLSFKPEQEEQWKKVAKLMKMKLV